VLPLALPPLRERQEDIVLLFNLFLRREAVKNALAPKRARPELLTRLVDYPWPGNIRELENVIERGVILTESNESISIEALFPQLQIGETIESQVSREGMLIQPSNHKSWVDLILSSGLNLDDIEEQLIREAMQQANNNVSGAARILGLTRPALAYRLKKIGLES